MKKYLIGITLGILSLVFIFTIATNVDAGKSNKSPNNGNSHEKATGDVWFSTQYGNVHIDFNAHETGPAKGWLRWERISGSTNWWAGPVISTDVYENEADFTVRVKEGALAVVGCDITFHVMDGGTPATAGDSINITKVVASPDQTCIAAGQIQGPYVGSAFYQGNLVVHYNWEYLETIEVPADGEVVETSAVLETGQEYMLEASGTYRFANWGEYGIADAEWAYRNDGYKDNPLSAHGWTVGELTYPSNLGIGLDVSVNEDNVDWGNYSPEHEYNAILIGDGDIARFNIYDSAYGDNSGFITVDIFAKLH